MKVVFVLWSLFMVAFGNVYYAPDLFHENIEDGKNILTKIQRQKQSLTINNTDKKHDMPDKHIHSLSHNQQQQKTKVSNRSTLAKHSKKNLIEHQLNSTTVNNFTKDGNFKKQSVFLIDSSKLDDDRNKILSPVFSFGDDKVGDIFSPDDTVIGDKKGDILDKSENSDLSGVDGSNPGQMEQNLILKSNEDSGSVLPITPGTMKSLDAAALQSNIPAEIDYLKGPKISESPFSYIKSPSDLSHEISQDKATDSLLEPTESSTKDTPAANFLSTAAAVKSDPGVTRAINADNIIDNSIKDAISAQMQQDVELATGKGTIQEYNKQKSSKTKSVEENPNGINLNSTFVGDIAKVAEVVVKAALDRSKKRQNNKLKKAKQRNIAVSKKENNSVDSLTSSLDISTRPATLTQSEQNLISSIDRAVREKDTANEMATRIMMPIKAAPFSDQTIAPSEQLLDMLSSGKFKDPLPENVLDRLASIDSSQALLQEQAVSNYNPMSAVNAGLMQVGPDMLPIRRLAIKMPETTKKPAIENKELVKAKKLMKTNPYYLAQNNMILNPKSFNTMQDLSNIGESIFSNNVIDLKQPMLAGGGGITPGLGAATVFSRVGGTGGTVPADTRGVDGMAGVNGLGILGHVGMGDIAAGGCVNCGESSIAPGTSLLKNQPQSVHQETHVIHNDIDSLVFEQMKRLPTVNLNTILRNHRKKHPVPTTYKGAISDTSIHHNTEDEFVPEHTIRLPEEHANHGYAVCKYGPCLNGGTCTAHPDNYYCSCLPGWIGTNCERRNSCFPNPCHYGTCSPNIDGFTCTCKTGFKGNLCNVLDRCHPNPCHSNGICTETYHGVQCECAPGFKGKLCEMESKCEPVNPCLNGGTCREFFDHYHCSCPESFQGQNCEEYISPTKAPPTVPQKLVGPQVIPAPINAPAYDVHDIYTFHSYDEFGKPISEVHREDFKKEPQSYVNSGANLVPHSNYLKMMHHKPGIPFIGAPGPSIHEGVILHKSDEDEKKPAKDKEETVKNLPDNTKDDRYQTHLVEVSKDKEGESLQHPDTNNGYHVGKPIALQDEHEHVAPSDNTEEELKVVKDNKEHREEMKENAHHHQHDEHTTNEMHKPQNTNVDHHHLDVPEHRHLIDTAKEFQNIIVEEQASERSKLLHKPTSKQTERGHAKSIVSQNINKQNGSQRSGDSEDDAKKNIQTIADLLKMFDKATKTLTSKIIKNTNKFMLSQGKQPFNPNTFQTDGSVTRNSQPSTTTEGPHFHPEALPDSKSSAITNYIQNVYNLTHSITGNLARSASVLGAKKNELIRQLSYKNFTDHQKSAYKTWRRQALINFHARNPDKQIPRNTISLSKNSLCPKFCRLFCDPWCVRIGCCHLSQDKLNIYRTIENEQSKLQQRSATERQKNDNNPTDGTITVNELTKTRSTLTCNSCNENADCIDGKCKCKSGFTGNGKTCTVDNCLLCHVNANCHKERCFCKAGYHGDGYECQAATNRRQECPRCNKMAECISGHCMCKSGFYGNGKQCWPLPIS